MQRKHPGVILNYFGSKARLAHKYPAPKYPNIIEPFAGGANYSLLWRELDVTICDLDTLVVDAWKYVIEQKEILSLPCPPPGVDVTTLGLCTGATALLRCSIGTDPTRVRITKGFAASNTSAHIWGERRRARTAMIAKEISHWKVHQISYENLPNIEATWYVDPPYQDAGKRYKFGSSLLDYKKLGEWCKSLRGQVIVCENEGANWLPFKQLSTHRGVYRTRNEVVWVNEE